jgi:Acetyltransferase (GNAT) domain
MRVWDAREPIEPEFEDAWGQCVSSSPVAHFGFDHRWIASRPAHGELTTAVLAEQGERRVAMVLRAAGNRVECGWPWRSHVLCVGPVGDAIELDPETAHWVYEVASRVTGMRRLRLFLPGPPVSRVPSFEAGATCWHDLSRSEDELHAALDPAKQRTLRKADRLGYLVREARDWEDLHAFAVLQRSTEMRRGSAAPAPPLNPGPGEAWREWEMPWMRLLVAEKDGVIHGGTGFAMFPGAAMDYRANASSDGGRRDGVNVLLAWEAIRQARDAGFRWINWSGSTRFKYEMGAVPVAMTCWLGGGIQWSLPNLLEAGRRRAHARVAKTPPEEPTTSTTRARTGTPGVLAAWSTREAPRPEFDEAWNRVLQRSARANFSLDLEYLRWDARQGLHARAVLFEHGGLRAAAVLRERQGEFVCGWPWRWQAAFEDEPGRAPVLGFDREESQSLFVALQRFASGRRLRCYLPLAPEDGTPAYVAGTTVFQSLEHSDEELLNAMQESKRRMVRRALAAGYRIEDGRQLELERAFVTVRNEAIMRNGGVPSPLADHPSAGEAWREWELPWMWLLVAVREGEVESGLGDGTRPGGVLEGRAGASTPRARKDGAFALLCYEELKRGRDLGHRWVNHGGDTPFKREIAGPLGRCVPLHCWLGGGSAWLFANASESWARRVSPRLATWARTLFTREAA